ncbi:MAG: hypothetical protein ACRDHZ_16605, partial [Ktedonobacteraceae bacterium]
LVDDTQLRQYMSTQSLAVISSHDRMKVLEEWETLYRRLSNEFTDAKEHRQRLRLARKNPHYQDVALHRPRIVRTGQLNSE